MTMVLVPSLHRYGPFIAILKLFGGEMGEGEVKEGAAAVFGRAGRRSSPPPAGRRPRARKAGRRRPCAVLRFKQGEKK
jgi:hypothetical protein